MELFAEHEEYHGTPDIIRGHRTGSSDPDLEQGGVGIDNTHDGQHIIIRKLRQNGFVITEIHENQFYVGKLKPEYQDKRTKTES